MRGITAGSTPFRWIGAATWSSPPSPFRRPKCCRGSDASRSHDREQVDRGLPARMKILQNISQLATCAPEGGQGEIHGISDAAMAWAGTTIRWVGPRSELPAAYNGVERLDARGGLVVPGLV